MHAELKSKNQKSTRKTPHAVLPFAFCLLLLASAVRADWTLTTADGKQQSNLTINTWNAADGLSATDQSGKLLTLPARDIQSLVSGIKVAPNPGAAAWKLVLRSGDVLYGEAVKVSGNSLMFSVEGINGDLAVPLKRVLTLMAPVSGSAAVAAKPKKLPSAVDHDIIVFKQADNLSGLFTSIDGANVHFAAEGSTDASEIPLTNIDTIVFGGAKPVRTLPPLSVRLTFDKGTVLTIPLDAKQDAFQWQLGTLTIKDAANASHTIKDDRIFSADIVGGRIVPLTELDIASEEQITFLGTNWPAQINKNVLGQPLRIGHTTFDHGIGVHTQSTLVYNLDGSFDALSLRVGLDDSAAPNGEAAASIVLDGKTLWSAKSLKPGIISPELSLPIKGGKRLELHADTAGKLDVQGRLNWVNISLKRQ